MHFAFRQVALREIRIVDLAVAENGFVQFLPFKNSIIENTVLENSCKCKVFALRKVDAGKFAVHEFDIGNFTILNRRIAQVTFPEYAIDEIDTGQVGEAALYKADLLVTAFQQWLNAKILIFNSVETAGVTH
jgi:hypothetical protein